MARENSVVLRVARVGYKIISKFEVRVVAINYFGSFAGGLFVAAGSPTPPRVFLP